MRALLALALLLGTGVVQAGTSCRAVTPGPRDVAAATASAIEVATALDAQDAPVALVARVGTDLSKHGLKYSHLGFALRDHPHGRWTVVHLLNRCGTASSGLFAQGLVDFFLDDLVSREAKLVWLEEGRAAMLAAHLLADHGKSVHEPRYSVISRPDSARWQNSTAWVLEVLVLADAPAGVWSRASAHAALRHDGFAPDVIGIPYTKRIAGGLFGANVSFTDHPLGARLGGRYEVVTVRAILRHARQHGWIARELALAGNTALD
ncbi:MAG TPA: DUF2145 domain-containing protein [Xanthomonadales bacterium]|nr:DUF2145 domain-containing protein [Xanthomonadales bacterium]